MKKAFIAGACLAALLGAQQIFGQKKGDPVKGKSVFEDNCAVCHNADSDEKKMGPGLKGLYKKAKLANGKKPTDEVVMDLINKGGGGMPAFEDQLSADEKAQVLAYLKTL
ncbi:MAG TPA: cytochrome c [Bryobacteraceae bacterium]|nr:cytochrome c [Bryobacteraceae bacterium]